MAILVPGGDEVRFVATAPARGGPHSGFSLLERDLHSSCIDVNLNVLVLGTQVKDYTLLFFAQGI